MENSATAFQTLFEKVTVYVQTSLELYKLEAISIASNMISSIATRVVLVIVVLLFSFFLNIGIALLLGKWLGEFYLGFFAMACFYLLLTILFLVFQEQLLKNPISSFIIQKMIKKDENE